MSSTPHILSHSLQSDAKSESGTSVDFWEPKRTMTLEAAYRHSRMIRLIRQILLGLSALLIAVLIWQFARQGPNNFPEDNPDESVRMINPRYSGRTDDGLPFYLTAEEAVRTTTEASEIQLNKPILHFFRIEGAEESMIVAKNGTYDDVNKILNLEETVDLRTDDGTQCKTTHARIFAKTKMVQGDKPIDCTGNFGRASGNSFEILDNYSTFVFKDRMSAVLDQKKSGSRDPENEDLP